MLGKLPTLILALLLALSVITTRGAQKPGTPEFEVVATWNAIVENIRSEDAKLIDLYNSLNKYRPGRVLFAPDVRAEQNRNRVKLIDEIIAHDRDRIRELQKLKKAEEASE